MKFKSTRKEFTFSDEGGYSFDVVLTHDSEYGWNAHVSFASHGYANEHAALGSLKTSVVRFLEMLNEAQP